MKTSALIAQLIKCDTLIDYLYKVLYLHDQHAQDIPLLIYTYEQREAVEIYISNA